MCHILKIRKARLYSLTNTKAQLRLLALQVAKELGIGPDKFKASRNFIDRFAKRFHHKFRKTTTTRVQPFYSFLYCWIEWIKPFREWVKTLGICTPIGYIRSANVWNIDEWGFEPDSKTLKHMVPEDANMINVQQLTMVPAVKKRMATVCGIVPKSGFPKNC